MSNEILSTLGFDASKAISELKKLDSALASTDKNFGNLALGMATFNSKAGQVPATLAALAASAQKLGASLGSVPGAAGAAATNLKALTSVNVGQTTQSVERLTTSVGLLSRIVFTQAVIKGLRTLENGFVDAGSSAAHFQTQLAEIATVSQSFPSLDKMGADIRAVSDALNVPLQKTGGALFEIAQAQIGKNGDEQIQFLKTVAEFSKSTVSSIESSSKLLSGALNAFDLGVGDADRVASQFFKTIDLGVISAEQLATGFGTVAPLARQLGVSIEEVQAAISTLTRRGVAPSQAFTQFRGALTAFAKPTDELQAAFKKVGATTGESLFRAEGFGGALQKVIGTTDGTSESIAKLFPNVRGLSGALALGGQAAKDFASDLSQVKAVSSTLNRQNSKNILSIDGQRVESEINKIKNAITVDFGQSVLKAGVALSDFVGGADNVVKVVSSIGPAFIGAAGAVGIFAAQSRVAALNGTALGGALGKLGTVGLALGAAFSAGDFIGDKISESLGANLKKQESDNASALTTFKSAESDKLKAAEESDTARVQSALRANEQITKGFLDSENAISVTSKRMAEGFERSLQQITGAREKFADEIGKAEQQARDSAKDSHGRAFDLTAKHDDRTFQNNLRGVPDLLQVSRLTDRAQQLGKQAQQQLTGAALSGDADAIQRALKGFGRAEQAGEQAQAIAQRIGNRTAEANAISTINSLTQKQLGAERELQKISLDRAKALDAEKEKQKAIAEQIREHAKTATENSGLFDKQGNLIPADEQAKRTAKRQQALKDIVGLGLSQKDLSVADALGLTKLTTELGNEINRQPIALKFIAEEESVAKLQQKLQDAFKTFRGASPIDVSKLEKLTGRTLDTPDQVSAAHTGLKDEAATIRKNLSAQSVDRQRISQLRGEIGTINSDFDSTGRNALRGASGIGVKPEVMQAALTAIQQFRSELTRLASDSDITAEEIAKLQTRLGALKEFAGSTSSLTNAGLKVDTEALDTGLAKVREIRALQQQPAADTGRLSEIESFLQQSAQAAAPFEKMAGALSGSVETSAGVAANLERAALAAERAARAQSAGGGAGAAGGEELWRGGKPRYFAGGGPVGPDRIPAWLSQGESVNTRAATSKFYSQISAMNAGHSPTAASVVGDTTVNVGDINVTGGATNGQTGDAIVNAIRRSYRRGSSRTL
jgi:TP901 family phage tail tape measure protein